MLDLERNKENFCSTIFCVPAATLRRWAAEMRMPRLSITAQEKRERACCKIERRRRRKRFVRERKMGASPFKGASMARISWIKTDPRVGLLTWAARRDGDILLKNQWRGRGKA
jgi:hypothetical protein